MADTRGLTKTGHWLNWADDYLAMWERLSARVPEVKSRLLTNAYVQGAANDELAFAAPPEAGVVVSARFVSNITPAAGGGLVYLMNEGTAGVTDTTMASWATAAVVAYKPEALSLSTVASAIKFAAGAGLSWKRLTAVGGTVLGVAVTVEYAPDVTDQLADLGAVNAAVRITRVTYTPDTTYASGAIYLVNAGTAGTAATTVATKAAASLTGSVPYTLTLDTTYDDITARQRLAFRRATASGDKTMPGGKVDVEFALSRAEYDR